jgi:hypothetical protein
VYVSVASLVPDGTEAIEEGHKEQSYKSSAYRREDL